MHALIGKRISEEKKRLAVGVLNAALLLGPLAGCESGNMHPSVPTNISTSVSVSPTVMKPKADIKKNNDNTVSVTPTTLTLLRSGTTLLAYVSVPSDGTFIDREDLLVDFYYGKPQGEWKSVPGCAHVQLCEISDVVKGMGGSALIQARFTPDQNVPFAPSKEDYPVDCKGAQATACK